MFTAIFYLLFMLSFVWWMEDNLPHIDSVMDDIERNGRPYVTVETYRDKEGAIKHRWVTVPRQPGWVGARMAWKSFRRSWAAVFLVLLTVSIFMGI